MNIKLCKIQKATNFTHFIPKIFHINPSKTMNIYTFATVYIIILLISHFAPFFSLLYAKQTDFSSPYRLFPQIHTNTNTPTPKHIHTNKSTQRYTNTNTNSPTHKHNHAVKPIERQISSGVGRLWIGDSGARSEFVGRQKWVQMLVNQCWWQRSVLVSQQEWVLMLVDWCQRQRLMLVGRRSPCLWVLILVVLVSFDSYGSYGGHWCLWWINDLTMRGKRRRRCLWREVI